MGRTASELQRLVEADATSCSVCRFVSGAMREHIDKLFYERVTDIPTREAIRKARGFCRRHATAISEHADALGTAIIMQDIIINELRALDAGRLDRPPAGSRGLSRLLETASWGREVLPLCPLCDVERDIEADTVDDLLSGLSAADFRGAFCKSKGLCLPHFRLAYDRCKDVQVWKIVLEAERSALADLATELGELTRKYDYRNRDEPRGDESDSWRRALHKTSGDMT